MIYDCQGRVGAEVEALRLRCNKRAFRRWHTGADVHIDARILRKGFRGDKCHPPVFTCVLDQPADAFIFFDLVFACQFDVELLLCI